MVSSIPIIHKSTDIGEGRFKNTSFVIFLTKVVILLSKFRHDLSHFIWLFSLYLVILILQHSFSFKHQTNSLNFDFSKMN